MQNSFPIKFFSEKSNKLDAFLKKKLLKNNKIICNIGSIGPSHYLSEVIESFQYLNKKYILIIAGSSINNYHLTLLNKINKLNLNNQVFIFKNIKNKFWFEVLFKSKIGLCFYKQDCTSHKFMAGTSTKFNNYLMANVPMLVNFNKDFLRFKKKFDIFDTVDPKNPKKIAKKINSLINNKNRYHQIKVKQKKSFNSHLNFDYQFKKSYKIVLK